MTAAGQVRVKEVKDLIIVTVVAVGTLENDRVTLASWSRYIILPRFKFIAPLELAVTVWLIYAVDPAPVNALPSPKK